MWEIIKSLPVGLKDFAFLMAGLIGAFIAGIKKKISRWQMFQSLLTGIFVSWIIGTILGSWFDLSNEVVYAFCALAGHFSDEILKQGGILVSHISDVVLKKIDGDK